MKLIHSRKRPPPAAAPRTPGAILEVSDLEVDFSGGQGPRAVQGLSLALTPGRVVGIAGESGSGKSVSALSIIGLLPRTAHVEGSIRYRGEELVGTSERRWRELRGRDIAMVFQETVSALNPVVPVGRQMTLAARNATGRDQGADRIRAALREVGLSDVDRVLRSYPHELSGGMCQRVVIAMALSCGSKVLLADEPTTALDVCVQQEVLALLKSVVENHGLAVVLISHDLGVLAQLCDDLIVMYQGQVMEKGAASAILRGPASPYTAALLRSLPRVDGQQTSGPPSVALGGGVAAGPGCPYSTRCGWATVACETNPPLDDFDDGDAEHQRLVRCWHASDVHHSRAGLVP